MAALLNNLVIANSFAPGSWTAATVATGDAPIPDVGARNGISGASRVFLSNTTTPLVLDNIYTAYCDFGGPSYDISADNAAMIFFARHEVAGFNALSTDADALQLLAFSGGGTTNWAAWYLPNPAPFGDATWAPMPMAGPPDATGGAFDNTDVTAVGFGYKSGATGAEFALGVVVDQCFYVNGEVDWADDNTDPTTELDYVALLAPDGGTYYSALVKQAGPNVEIGIPVRVTARNFSNADAAIGISFRSDGVGYQNIPDDFYSLTLQPVSGSQTFNSAFFVTIGATYNFTVDSTLGTVEIGPFLASGLNAVSLETAGTTITGATIIAPNTLSIANAELEATIDSAVAAIDWNAPLAIGSVIRINSDIDVSFDVGDYSAQSVIASANLNFAVNPATDADTYVFTGITGSGTVNFDNDSVNDTTVSINGSLSATVEGPPTTGGGDLVLSQPIVSLTLTDLVPGSNVRVYETGTQTLLGNVASSGTSFVLPYTGTPTVDYTVYNVDYGFVHVIGLALPVAGTTQPVAQVEDRAYEVSSGLTFGVTATIDTGTLRFGLTVASTVQNWYSFWKEAFIAEVTLDNFAFPLSPFGPDSFSLEDGYEFDGTSSINNLSRDGFRYVDVGGTSVAEWCAVLSTNSGDVSTFQARYQQVAGSGTTSALTLGAVDQVIQTYGDAGHGNFDYRGYLVFKMQPNGYTQAAFDMVATLGLSTIEPVFYVISLDPVPIEGFVLGDPGVTGLTLTNYGASPITRETLQYSAGIVDTGGNSNEDIHRWLNYNISLGGTFQGEDAFNWPDFVFKVGSSYQTLRDPVEGSAGAALKGLFIEIPGTIPHPGFFQQQADDGTFFVLPVQATGQVLNIIAGSRLKVRNVTQAVTLYNDIPGTSYTVNYTDGTDYAAGDVVDIFLTEQNGVTASLRFDATTVASTSGWTVIADQEEDTIYAGYGLDGSTITKFSADYIDDEVDIITATNFTGQEVYAWLVYNETTSQGIDEFFGGFTAIDAANIQFNSIINLFFDNITTTNLWQTDNIRLFREDGIRPVRNPTTAGGGVDVNWREKVFLQNVGGGPLTGPQEAQLAQASEAQAVNVKVGTPAVTVSDDIATRADQVTVDAILTDTSELQTDWTTGGRLDVELAAKADQVTVDALPTAVENADGLLARNIAGGSDGGRNVTQVMRANRNRVERDEVAGVVRIYEEDDTTVSHTYAITAADVDPIVDADPT